MDEKSSLPVWRSLLPSILYPAKIDVVIYLVKLQSTYEPTGASLSTSPLPLPSLSPPFHSPLSPYFPYDVYSLEHDLYCIIFLFSPFFFVIIIIIYGS